MRIGICEDETATAEAIAAQVTAFFREKGYRCDVACFSSGEALLTSRERFDLLFLDCRLPDGNGLDVARELNKRENPATLIFISAYDDYVYESFEVSPFRFLRKPVEADTLKRSLDSFMAFSDRDIVIEIPTREKTVLMRLSEIVYIESDKKNTIVRFNTPSRASVKFYESTRSLNEYCALIRNPRFFRTHKRFFVNMDYIKSIEANTIKLSVGEQVEISRRNMSMFDKAYNNYLKNSF